MYKEERKINIKEALQVILAAIVIIIIAVLITPWTAVIIINYINWVSTFIK